MEILIEIKEGNYLLIKGLNTNEKMEFQYSYRAIEIT